MSWIPYPRPGTSVLDGTWLCTVERASGPEVRVLRLKNGEWQNRDGSPLSRREQVTAIDYMPKPYRAPT